MQTLEQGVCVNEVCLQENLLSTINGINRSTRRNVYTTLHL